MRLVAGCSVLGNPPLTGSPEARMKRFRVFNRTDGIPASPDSMTLQEAEAFVREFPKRYKQQGYFLTATGERIPPESVKLVLLDLEWEPVRG